MPSETPTVTLPRALWHLSISLASWGVTLGVSYVTVRMAQDPDYLRTLGMRLARTGEQVSMRQAQKWAQRATASENLYRQLAGVNA